MLYNEEPFIRVAVGLMLLPTQTPVNSNIVKYLSDGKYYSSKVVNFLPFLTFQYFGCVRMECLGPWKQARKRTVVCLTFVLILSLYLASSPLTMPPFKAEPHQGPPAQVHSAIPQAMPLLGTLPTNTSRPARLNCRHGYLRATSPAGQTEASSPPRDEWQEAVGAGATLHECPVCTRKGTWEPPDYSNLIKMK